MNQMTHPQKNSNQPRYELFNDHYLRSGQETSYLVLTVLAAGAVLVIAP